MNPDAGLFEGEVRRVRLEADAGLVPSPNSHGASYGVDTEGGRWIVRRGFGCQQVLAECASYYLGKRIGVSIPEIAVDRSTPDVAVCSRLVEAVGHWDPALIDRIQNLEALGAMLTLDVLIMNEDRHARNILLQHDRDELHLRAWAIDHEAALIGWAEDYRDRVDALPSLGNHTRPMPISLLVAGAMQSAEIAQGIPADELLAMLHEPCVLAVQEEQKELLANCLHRRTTQALSLVGRYLDQLKTLS